MGYRVEVCGFIGANEEEAEVSVAILHAEDGDLEAKVELNASYEALTADQAAYVAALLRDAGDRLNEINGVA